MKQKTFKPGFEFIFSLCILAVLGLPPLVFAQAPKDVQITINNGDTVINGKNIKDLSPELRYSLKIVRVHYYEVLKR